MIDSSKVIGATVRGYASVYDVMDDHETIFDQGTFSRWLAENPGRQVPIHWFHNGIDPIQHAIPIGVTTQLKEDKRGLYYEGNLFNTAPGFDVIRAMAGGAVRYSSVTFRRPQGPDAMYLDENDQVHFRSLDLIEISVLPYPGNWQTSVELVEAPALAGSPTPARGQDPDVIELFAQGLQRFTREK
jgi:HK97 family phage prohead protease